MKKDFVNIFLLFAIFGCSIRPSPKLGVDEKYKADSVFVKIGKTMSLAYILDKSALNELDSLQSVSYVGTDQGRHIFIQWSQIAPPPYSITLFGIDSQYCRIANPNPIEKEEKIKVENGVRYYRPAKFVNGKCEVSEHLK